MDTGMATSDCVGEEHRSPGTSQDCLGRHVFTRPRLGKIRLDGTGDPARSAALPDKSSNLRFSPEDALPGVGPGQVQVQTYWGPQASELQWTSRATLEH